MFILFYNFTSNCIINSLYSFPRADIEKAVRKKRKFDFTHYVLISKTYRAKALPSEVFYTNSEEKLFQEVSHVSDTSSSSSIFTISL